MKQYFPTIATLAASLMSTVLVPALKADENNKLTTITIDQSIDVQGTVLPAGSYVIKLLGSPVNRFNVLIYNADENHVIANVLAIPAYRLRPTGDSKFMFYETEEGQAPALHTWFYPGDNSGFEFRAPRRNALANSKQSNPPKVVASIASDNYGGGQCWRANRRGIAVCKLIGTMNRSEARKSFASGFKNHIGSIDLLMP